MRVGFAGLGRMGAFMAHNLVRSGIDLAVWNRSVEKAEAFAAATGAAVAETPQELAQQSDCIITMLADDQSSSDVHFGNEGLFAANNGARLYVEMGTMSPAHISHLARAAPAATSVIDAPVSGATKAAEEAQLLIMAGCSEEDAKPLMPLFSAMAKQTICLGRSGAGAVMKLAVNSLIHGINQTLGEAMTLAEASGIDSEKAFDVIEASAACAPMLKYRRALYLDEYANEVTFTVALARKDMEITKALAEQAGTMMAQGQVTLDVLVEAERAGYGERDMASILNFLREKRQ